MYVDTCIRIIHMCLCNVSAFTFSKETRVVLDTLKVVGVKTMANISGKEPQP